MKLLRLHEVIQMTGLSRSTIYRYEGAAVFPKRRRAGPNSVRWFDADVIKWMETRPEAVAPQDAAEAQSRSQKNCAAK
jgi:prophage regulatory protein